MLTTAKLLKCLADETRLRCLSLVFAEGELCVCELTYALDEPQPKISRHLAQLRGCGVLLDRRHEQWVYYKINPSLPGWANSIIHETVSAMKHFKKYDKDAKRLSKMASRPKGAPCCV